MAPSRPPDATIRLSGSDTTFILDEAIEPQHTLKIAVFDEASSKDFPVRPHEPNARRRGGHASTDAMAHTVRASAAQSSAMDHRLRVRRAQPPSARPRARARHQVPVVSHDRRRRLRTDTTRGPPWELWFLEGFQGTKVLAVLKMNHAMADGGTISELLEMLTSPEPGEPIVVPPVPRLASAVSRGDALRDGVRELWQEYRHELPRRLRAIRKAHVEARKGKPTTRLPSKVGAQAPVARPADSCPILLVGFDTFRRREADREVGFRDD